MTRTTTHSPRETTGYHGRSRETAGDHVPLIWDPDKHPLTYGRPRDITGDNGRPLDTTGDHGPRIWDPGHHTPAYGRPRDTTGDDGRPRATDLGPEQALVDPKNSIEDPTTYVRKRCLGNLRRFCIVNHIDSSTSCDCQLTFDILVASVSSSFCCCI